MEKKESLMVLLMVASFIILALIAFRFNFFTGKAITGIEFYNLNSSVSGEFILTIEQGDSLNQESTIFVGLLKKNTEIVSRTISLKEFIELSEVKINAVKRNNGFFYETPGNYRVDAGKIINYVFSEKGEYELIFMIIKMNLLSKKKIIVD